MKKIILLVVSLLVSLIVFNCNNAKQNTPNAQTDTSSKITSEEALDTTVTTKEMLAAMTWEDALRLLKEGNNRFTEGKRLKRDLLRSIEKTKKDQFPFAVVLSCMDSRTPTELIFDQGIGDIFNLGIAGNFENTDILGSMEYACHVIGTKLIVVIGHNNCGAVKGACDNIKLGNLTNVLESIEPAVKAVKDVKGERNSKNPAFVEAVAKENVMITMREIKEKSPILRALIDSGKVGLVGAMYDIETGKVEWY